MKIKFDSSSTKRKTRNFTNEKFATKTFQEITLFKKKYNLSSPNFDFDIQKFNNFKLMLSKNKTLNLKRVIKPTEYDLEFLTTDLITFRSELIKRKNELFNLKIKCTKLLTDNIKNKALIANVLSIPMNKPCNKEMLFDKIKNYKLTKEERQILNIAYEIIKLKLELNSKKKLFSENVTYLSKLIENSRVKVVSNLHNDYFIKCEQQRSLIDTLVKLEKKYDIFEKKIIELKEDLKIKCENSEILIGKEYDGVEEINQFLNEKNNILKEINLLKDKINKYEKVNNGIEREIKKLVSNNLYDQNKLKVIEENSYSFNDDIDLKVKEKEDLETILQNNFDEINSLQENYFKLRTKFNNYIDEKQKLIQKSKESKKNIDKIKSLEKELKYLKENIENFKELKNKNEKELNEMNIKNDNENNNHYGYMKENESTKIELQKRIDELKLMIDKKNNEENLIESEINQRENEYNELCNKIINIKNEHDKNNLTLKEKLKNIEEEKKNDIEQKIEERQKEIDNLKEKQQNLIQNKKKLEDENELMQGEIKEFDQKLVEYDEVSEEFSKIKDKISDAMFNELLADIKLDVNN